MGNREDKIAMARRHVEEGRRIVERLRRMIAEKRGGPDAKELLNFFERSQEIFEGDLERLMSEQARKAASDGRLPVKPRADQRQACGHGNRDQGPILFRQQLKFEHQYSLSGGPRRPIAFCSCT